MHWTTSSVGFPVLWWSLTTGIYAHWGVHQSYVNRTGPSADLTTGMGPPNHWHSATAAIFLTSLIVSSVDKTPVFRGHCCPKHKSSKILFYCQTKGTTHREYNSLNNVIFDALYNFSSNSNTIFYGPPESVVDEHEYKSSPFRLHDSRNLFTYT